MTRERPGGRRKPPAELILPVGRSPFDGYLALAALRPRRAHLAYGPVFQGSAHRLARVAADRLGIDGRLRPVADDADYGQIVDAWAHAPASAHLHYTGGSGVLDPALRGAFATAGRPLAEATSLDGDRRLLRYDDGADIELAALIHAEDVDLPALLALGGFLEREHQERAEARRERLDEILAATLRRFRPGPRANGSAMLHELSRHLRDRVGHDPDGAVRDWPNGRFFEDVVRHFVELVAPSHDVRSGVRVARDDLRVELDVIAVGHYRPYVISCAIGGRADTIRFKMFEVLHRARQVGGPGARCAIACTLADDADLTPAELEGLVRDSPEPEDQPAVFGAADIAGWLRGDDRALDRLREFLHG